MRTLRPCAASLALAFLASGPAMAGEMAKCTFVRYCTADPSCEETELSFMFVKDAETWMVAGNNGVAEVQSARGETALSFMEQVTSGVVQTTTVDLSDGAAVHSRHTLGPKGFRPAQYFGTCVLGGGEE